MHTMLCREQMAKKTKRSFVLLDDQVLQQVLQTLESKDGASFSVYTECDLNKRRKVQQEYEQASASVSGESSSAESSSAVTERPAPLPSSGNASSAATIVAAPPAV